ncbi:hypothetical protein HPB50_014677 [Hyalomma asiaticum]|uniref:Uncharacterized protein n=1 Tax=Hyalomma asiaticum TaxID=266040 RepID=A0ACB7S743_HYAAI|nr:hypothetical protein HPB50_014677 [Hyalomma asiaticum]
MWLEAPGPVGEGIRRACSLHFGESAFRHDADTRCAAKRIRLRPDSVPQASASSAEVERSVTNAVTPVTPVGHAGHKQLTGADGPT